MSSKKKPTEADIRRAGISPLTGLKSPITSNQQEADEIAEMESQYAASLNKTQRAQRGIDVSSVTPLSGLGESVPYEQGSVGAEFGKSKYDRGDMLTPMTSFDQLSQRRYEEQPWYDVAANGIAKAFGRAATSFVTGVAGGVFGAGEFLYQGLKNGEWNAANLIDNHFSNALADLDEWADKNFVNYKSVIQQQNEENGEWYKNLTGLNMIMDDIVTNFGFVVGMGAAAAVTGGVGGAFAGGARKAAAAGLRAARRAGNMAKISAATKAAGIVQNYGRQTAEALTLINSSAGEAALEGLQVKREMMQEETDRINSTIDQNINNDPNIKALDNSYQAQMQQLDMMYMSDRSNPEYERQKAAITGEYQKQREQMSEIWNQRRQAALQELDEASDRAGTATALLNMAILVPSNFNLYGRLINKSFRNAEKSAGHSWAVNGSEIYRRNALNQQNIIGSIKGKSWDEIRNTAKNYRSRTALGNIAKREASAIFSEGIYEEMGQAAASTGAKAYHQWNDADNYWRARLDPDSIDRVADGSHDFLSALGQGLSETYGSVDGWREGFIGGISGGLFGLREMRGEFRDTGFARRTSKELNEQLQSDRLPNLLQHIVAQSFHDNVKDGYARMNDQGAWKTEDDKQAYALISAFDRAGRMDDLQHLINSYTEQMSDEEVEDMINSSTRTVTTQDQIAQMKQEIRKNTAEKIEANLRDGASMDDYMRSRSAVDEAKAALDSAETTNEAESARAAYNEAVRNYNNLFSSPESEAKVNEAIAEYEELNRKADSSSPEEYLDGPFTSTNGKNTLTRDEVREQIKHNTDRIHEVVKRYQDAVEKVNRDTRGILSKDQEDYLAYAQFMAESSGFRAQEMVEKWRGILPEVLTILHKNKSSAARFAGVDESQVEEDPDNPGYFRVNTKNMTDNQFSNFVLHGLLKQSHVQDKNDTGDGTLTEKKRQTLADIALSDIQREWDRTGRQTKFDKDELRRDFEDIENYFKKNEEYAKAYIDAMSNPEGILTAKEKALRWLKKKYDAVKERANWAKKSMQELADATDEELQKMPAYQFAKAKYEKIKNKLLKFYDDQIADALESIQDNELRNELFQRIKKALVDSFESVKEAGNHVLTNEQLNNVATEFSNKLNDIIDQLKDAVRGNQQNGVQAMIQQNPDGSFNRFSTSMLNQAIAAIEKLKGNIPRILEGYRKLVNTVSSAIDKVREKAKKYFIGDELDENSNHTSILDAIKNLVGKYVSAENREKLKRYIGIARDKIRELNKNKPAGYKKAVDALKNGVRSAEQAMSSQINKKRPDTEPATSHPSGGSGASRVRRSTTQSSSGSASDTGSEHNQNPDIAEERKAIQSFVEIDSAPMATSDIWQSTTGEFARRSGYTYLPYHEIINNYLKDYPVGESTNEDQMLPIPEFEEYGTKPIREWRKIAHRSAVIHKVLKDHGAFGHIDNGEVKHGDRIKFRMLKKDGEFIVFLVHNGHIIGDLSHPEFGGKGTGLTEMYEKFQQEYNRKLSTAKNGFVDSEYETSVANVYAGQLCYAEKDSNGDIPTRTVASLSNGQNLSFFVAGVSDPSTDPRDAVGNVNKGQPYVLIPMPNNNGLERRRAVPVMTEPITNDDTTSSVIIQAINYFGDNRSGLQKFLQHFLWCRSVSIFDADIDGKKTTVVKLTSQTLVNGMPASVEIRLNDSDTITVLGNTDAFRANVSYALLNGRYGVPMYEDVVKGTSLPKTYNEFLSKICKTRLIDSKVHNSWITINKLRFEGDKAIEEKDPVQRTNKLNQEGHDTTVVRDEQTNNSYRISIKRRSGTSPYSITRVEYSHNKRAFRLRNVTPRELSRMLPIVAQAVMDAARVFDGKLQFELNGVVYEFTAKRNGALKVLIASDQLNNRSIDSQVLSMLGPLTYLYDGTDSSIDKIIDEWFDSGFPKKGSQRYKDLRDILKALKDNKTRFTGIPVERKAALLNLKKTETNAQKQGKRIARKLVQVLAGKGIRINTDKAEAQRILDNWRRGTNNGKVQMFYKDGQTLLGFVYNGTIYLDEDLLTPETLIHEYTHMWCNALRASNNQRHKDMWNGLVSAMKKHKDLWDNIKDTYKLTDDDAVADEVFARLSGQDGEQWLRNEISKAMAGSTSNDIESAFDTFRNALKSLIDFIKQYILGISTDAETFGDMMKELVWRDMMSNDTESAININMIMESSHKSEAVKVTQFKMSELQFDDSEQQEYFHDDYEDNITEVDGEEVFTVPEGESITDIAEKYGFTVGTPQAHIAMQARPTNAATALESAIGPQSMSSLLMAYHNGHISAPSLGGLTEISQRIGQSFQRGYVRADDMIAVAEAFMTEEQRNEMWSALMAHPGIEVMSKHKAVAELNHMFNRFIQGESINNPELESSFRVLQESMHGVIDNETLIRDFESSGVIEYPDDITAPTDEISTLTEDERMLINSEALDLLTAQDIGYLDMYDMPVAVYRALPSSSKERIRKCVM